MLRKHLQCLEKPLEVGDGDRDRSPEHDEEEEDHDEKGADSYHC